MSSSFDLTRPYIVIPKLVEQPTWGGDYIVAAKGWAGRPGHDRKIGQSYELFSGSNLSLIDTSDDPNFGGELTDRDAAQVQTRPQNSIALADMIAASPVETLGQAHIAEHGTNLGLLIKFTQALGNSFQVHIKAGSTHPYWKPKPESWYFFEPGLLTLGVRPEADWGAYHQAVTAINAEMAALGQQVKNGELTHAEAQPKIQAIIDQHDPWQYVNIVAAQKDQLFDLSSGGQHHSWEEDVAQAPLGNVLYELQSEAMDDVSTLRSFDKGKMSSDGHIRDVHIDDYFAVIDRSPEANDPQSHIKQPQVLSHTDSCTVERLMQSPYYSLEKLTFMHAGDSNTDSPNRFKHLFVKEGGATVSAGGHDIFIGRGHSCFVPASVGSYAVTCTTDNTQVLVSY